MPVFRLVNVAVRKAFALALGRDSDDGEFAQEPAQNQPRPPLPITVTQAMIPLPQAPKPQGNTYQILFGSELCQGAETDCPSSGLFGTCAPSRRRISPIRRSSTGSFKTARFILSLDDAVALALENNLDIAIQRYNLITADTDILRTSSGSPALGVNTGLVQGTPGGTPGSTASGGTGTAATGRPEEGQAARRIGVGGAAAGAAGIVASTQGEGAPIDNFDPVLTGTGEEQHAISPTTNIFAGATRLNQATTTANLLYTQGFPTGTLMSVGFNNNRISINSTFNTVNPSLSSNFTSSCVSICYRVLVLTRTFAGSASRATIAPSWMPRSKTRSCRRSLRLKTSTGTWSTLTRMSKCKSGPWNWLTRPSPIRRSRWISARLAPDHRGAIAEFGSDPPSRI